MARRVYIPTLDGWRTVAIVLVLGAHSCPALERMGDPLATALARLFAHAGYGVDIFFSLSGYLICTLLLDEKQRLEGRIELGRFYVRRAFRILPPLIAYLAALVALRSVGQVAQVSDRELVAALAFGRNYVPGNWYTAHFWSLAIEEHFYLIIPLVLSYFRWRSALVLAVGLSLASASWRAIEDRYGIVQPWLPGTLPNFRTEDRFDGLMNGATLALLLRRPRIRERLRRALSPVVVSALFGMTLVGLLAFDSQPARRTIVAIVLPLFLASTVLRPTSVAGILLEWPAIRWVGRLSYSLYLWQQLFLPIFVDPSPGPLGWLQGSLLSVFPAMACAVLSYYLIEKPMIRMGHRLASPPAKARLGEPARVEGRSQVVERPMEEATGPPSRARTSLAVPD
jgi:peptidoglycan/LPS O-acetylase OafA/YrhL